MGTLDLSTVELVSTLRQAPLNGPTNSQDFNDSQTEILADLASLSGFLNDILIPMLDGLSLDIQPLNQTAPHGLEGRYIFSDTSDLSSVFFDSLSNEPLSIAESLRVLQGITQAVSVTVANLNVEVTALQTQLSSTNQNDIAQALQNIQADLLSLTAQTIANTQSISDHLVVELMTDDVANTLQNKLNLKAGANVTLTPDANGGVQISAVAGAGGANDVLVTGNYVALSTDQFIRVNAGAGATITLTTTGIVVGKTYYVKNIGTGAVTVQSATGNIDNALTSLLTNQYDSAIYEWDGTNWWVF